MPIRIALAAIAVVAASARAEEPFADITLKQAKADAKERNRVVMIDFYTTWCGPCKQLDKTTWKDEDVRKWLDKNVIALKRDAEINVKTAEKYSVNAYPTILFIKPNGEEIDRMVGYRPPADFLAEARDLLAGKDSVARAREKAKGKDNDPMARVLVGQALANKGKDKEALEEFLWCYDHGLEHSPAFVGVRLSFLLSYIKDLGRTYPAAIDALKQRRDNARKAILSGKGNFREAQDFQALCRELGEPEAALELYDELGKREDNDNAHQTRQAMGHLMFEPLIKARRYKDALEAGGGADKIVDQVFQQYALTKSSPVLKEHREELMAYHKRTILETGGQVYEALLGAKKAKSARKLADRLLKFDGSDSTYELLIRHATCAKANDAVIELRKLQEQAEKKDESGEKDD